jgi:hypothetical protein
MTKSRPLASHARQTAPTNWRSKSSPEGLLVESRDLSSTQKENSETEIHTVSRKFDFFAWRFYNIQFLKEEQRMYRLKPSRTFCLHNSSLRPPSPKPATWAIENPNSRLRVLPPFHLLTPLRPSNMPCWINRSIIPPLQPLDAQL